MGLIKAAISSARGVIGDQWLEFINVHDNLGANVLLTKGVKVQKDPNGKINTSNTKGTGIITDGSKIIVPEGYYCLLVEDGKILDLVAEAGSYEWKSNAAPSVFSGQGFVKGVVESFKDFTQRFKYGGQKAFAQGVYYVNKKEILDNKFGTVNPMPYNDARYGNIYLRSYGMYSFKIENPILFISNVLGLATNEDVYVEEFFNSQLKSEFVQNVMAEIQNLGAENNLTFDRFIGKSLEISNVLSEHITNKWANTRGLRVCSVVIAGINPDDDSREYIREVDKSVNLGTKQGYVTMKQMEALNSMAKNEGGNMGPLFMGMGLGNVMGNQMYGAMNTNIPNNQAGNIPNQSSNIPNNQVNNGVLNNQNNNVFDTQKNDETDLNNPVNDSQEQNRVLKFCFNCGNKLSGNEKFCFNCGQKLQ